MNNSLLERLRELVAFPMERTGVDVTRSSYERFAIPYSFKPRLSFVEAVVAASGALLRIFLGSLLFAVWGTYTLLAWNAVRNVFARGIVLVVLVTLFAVSMAAVILAISALVRMVWPHREATKGAPANLTRT